MLTADESQLDEDIVRTLCGEFPDRVVLAILETGADLADLETALAWLAGQDDEMGEARRPLHGAAATAYDVLTREEAPAEER